MESATRQLRTCITLHMYTRAYKGNQLLLKYRCFEYRSCLSDNKSTLLYARQFYHFYASADFLQIFISRT